MPNKYTDQQMIWAAQITYLNFTDAEIEEWKNEHNQEYPTVRELLLNRIYIETGKTEVKTDDPDRLIAYKVFYNYNSDKAAVIDPALGEIADEGTRISVEFVNALLGINYQEVCEEYKDKIGDVFDIKGNEMLNAEGVLTPDVVADGEGQWYLECADWKVYSVLDDNSADQSGLYALTLMPAQGEAIVAYRGSEIGIVDGTEQDIQFLMDWMYADGGLAYGKLTAQEELAANYLTEILGKSEFNTVATSGHSLGGDLSLTAGVISGYNNSKYIQGAGFDAPGHPQEFHDRYAEQIEAVQGRLTHYYYTLVGGLYQSLAGDNYFCANVLDTEMGEGYLF